MGLDFAIDELLASGWTTLDLSGCECRSDGTFYPNVARVNREFKDSGFSLTIRHVQLFDCYRAEWRDGSGGTIGAVVGKSEAEAAVYALAQLRRQMAAAC